jgi:hypothetical protein
MPDVGEFTRYYKTLTDAELLNLKSQGGFTEEAEQELAEELRRRNLKPAKLKRHIVHERIRLREEAKEKGFAGRGPALLFFGRRYLNDADKRANIQLRTKWFALGGIPLVPIASYRFKCTGDAGKWHLGDPEQRVINRVPLNWTQVFLTWMKTAIFILIAFLLGVAFAWYRSHRIFQS